MEILSQNLPLTHAALSSSLKEYARPNDKISYLMETEVLYGLTKGKYVSKNAIKENLYLNHQSANILYGPSYISRFSALSFHGLLTESTTRIESMSLNRSKTIQTYIGIFQYFSLPNKAVFSLGVESKIINESCSFLIAKPFKAICDIIWTTTHLQINTVADLVYFLEEDLRIDIDMLKDSNAYELELCIQFGKKKRELELFLQLIEKI